MKKKPPLISCCFKNKTEEFRFLQESKLLGEPIIFNVYKIVGDDDNVDMVVSIPRWKRVEFDALTIGYRLIVRPK